MEKIHVRPGSKMIVRHPFPPYSALRKEGEHVPNNTYWRRRIKDKDVFLIKEKPAPPPKPAPVLKPPPPPTPPPPKEPVVKDDEKKKVDEKKTKTKIKKAKTDKN